MLDQQTIECIAWRFVLAIDALSKALDTSLNEERNGAVAHALACHLIAAELGREADPDEEALAIVLMNRHFIAEYL